jgi:hypothetical protein
MEKISQIIKRARLKADPGFGSGLHQWSDPGTVRFSPSFFMQRQDLMNHVQLEALAEVPPC